MKTYATLLLTILSLTSFSQEQTHFSVWQKANPTALVMTYDNFLQLSDEVQRLISGNVVFMDELNETISKDINTNQSALNSVEQTEEELSNSNLIKEWLANNSGVKIVKRSEYMAEESDLREVYNDAPHILVLIGEELTKEDILNY